MAEIIGYKIHYLVRPHIVLATSYFKNDSASIDSWAG